MASIKTTNPALEAVVSANGLFKIEFIQPDIVILRNEKIKKTFYGNYKLKQLVEEDDFHVDITSNEKTFFPYPDISLPYKKLQKYIDENI
jgi:hypothetical protein